MCLQKALQLRGACVRSDRGTAFGQRGGGDECCLGGDPAQRRAQLPSPRGEPITRGGVDLSGLAPVSRTSLRSIVVTRDSVSSTRTCRLTHTSVSYCVCVPTLVVVGELRRYPAQRSHWVVSLSRCSAFGFTSPTELIYIPRHACLCPFRRSLVHRMKRGGRRAARSQNSKGARRCVAHLL